MPYIRTYLNDVLLSQKEFDAGTLKIGRSSDCDIVIDNAGVSSIHAIIEKQGDAYIISDNDSTNGVFVNEKRVSQHKLEYWDEIQLYNYVLKFMAVSGMKKSEDPDIAHEGVDGDEGTMEISIENVEDLVRLKKQKKEAYVELRGRTDKPSRSLIKGTSFKLGKSSECDFHVAGWFSPAVSAEIKRQIDGYYLVPHKRGRVQLNGNRIKTSAKLEDGDEFSVKKVPMTFFHRVMST